MSAFPDTEAGHVQRQLENALRVACESGMAISPMQYCNQVVQLCLDRENVFALKSEINASGMMVAGLFEFTDGSRLKFDREGTQHLYSV